jgi:hypothetical protein
MRPYLISAKADLVNTLFKIHVFKIKSKITIVDNEMKEMNKSFDY